VPRSIDPAWLSHDIDVEHILRADDDTETARDRQLAEQVDRRRGGQLVGLEVVLILIAANSISKCCLSKANRSPRDAV